MKVLITGGTGFIGTHLSRTLSKEFEVHTLSIEEKPKNNDVIHHLADLTDIKQTKSVIDSVKPDYVFHLAAVPDAPDTVQQINDCLEVNVKGFVNLLECLKDPNLKSLVHVGSAKEYGNIKTPFKEDQMCIPSSSYAATKLCAEHIGLEYVNKGMPILFARLSSVYGHGSAKNSFIQSAIIKALSNEDINMTEGKQKRESMYISDAIDAMITLAKSPDLKGQIFNIGTGNSLEIIEIVKIIKKLANSSSNINAGKIPYRKNEVWDICSDISKAKKILKWQPKISIEGGLKLTIEAINNDKRD